MNPELVVYARVSSSKQVQGSSLSTQTNKKLIEEVTKELQIPFNGKLYIDQGKSGYHGKHLEGEFGQLLEDIATGVIAKDSVILVFNLDRMGRDELLAASVRFQSLLLGGVQIYTSMDRRLYSKDSKNLMADLMISLTIMQRAWEESVTKATRTTQAIEAAITQYEKDGVYSNKVGVCPAFIDHTTGKLNDHAPAFRYIVTALLDGVSDWHILQHLKENYTPVRKAWSLASITKIKKRCPEYLIGNKVFTLNGVERRLEGFYESLITIQEYNSLKVLSTVRERRSPKQEVADIFLLSGLVQCPLCEGSMISFRKSPTLCNVVCSAAQKGEKHHKELYNLPTIEALTVLLTQDYINQSKLQQDSSKSNNEISVFENQIARYTKAIEGLESDLEEEYSPALVRALKSYESKLKTTQEALQKALTGNIDTSSLESEQWLKMALSDTYNTDRNQLKIILNQIIDKVVISRVKHTPSKVEKLQNKALTLGTETKYWLNSKGDYYSIGVKVLFKDGGERWLQVSPVMLWKGKQAVSFIGDDVTQDKHLNLRSMRVLKQVIRELDLVKGLITSKGRFTKLELY